MVYLITLLSTLYRFSGNGMITDREEQKSLDKNLPQGQFVSRYMNYSLFYHLKGDGSIVRSVRSWDFVICVWFISEQKIGGVNLNKMLPQYKWTECRTFKPEQEIATCSEGLIMEWHERLEQGCTIPGHLVTRAIKFGTVVPSIFSVIITAVCLLTKICA
jgi:hypothetical protein